MTAQAIIIRALVALVAIPFHEAGHALAAWLLGDATAKREGRLSLNPFAHFDLLGTLCMVFAGVGWAKPVSTNPRNFKNPKWGMALTALAGPAANLLLEKIKNPDAPDRTVVLDARINIRESTDVRPQQ